MLNECLVEHTLSNMHMLGVQVLIVNGAANAIVVELNSILFCYFVDVAISVAPFATDKNGASTKIEVLVDRFDLFVCELVTGTREKNCASFMKTFQCYRVGKRLAFVGAGAQTLKKLLVFRAFMVSFSLGCIKKTQLRSQHPVNQA